MSGTHSSSPPDRTDSSYIKGQGTNSERPFAETSSRSDALANLTRFTLLLEGASYPGPGENGAPTDDGATKQRTGSDPGVEEKDAGTA